MRKNTFRRWLRRRRLYTGRLTRVRYYPERHDLPDVPRANELAVAGNPQSPKWLLLDCPCGNGHTILLPLATSRTPRWSVLTRVNAKPSISPSIDRNRHEGTRCHFWVREGKIRWVGDGTRSADGHSVDIG